MYLGLNKQEARLLCTRNEGGTCSLHERLWTVANSLQDRRSVDCSFMRIERLFQSAVLVCHDEAVEAEAGRPQPNV